MKAIITNAIGFFYPSVNEDEIEGKIKFAYGKEQYSEVIELASQLNWTKKPFSPAVAAFFLRSYYYTPGADDKKALEFANLFIGFYGNVEEKEHFKIIKALIYESDADHEQKRGLLSDAVNTYDIALSWVEGSKLYPKVATRIKQKVAEASAALKLKNERERAAKQAREKFMSKTLDEFPELKEVLSPLRKHGILTVGDLAGKRNSYINDEIEGIGPQKMAVISKFKSENNL